MTKMRQWTVVTIVAVLVVLVAGWLLLVKPEKSKVSSLKSQATAQDQANQLKSEDQSVRQRLRADKATGTVDRQERHDMRAQLRQISQAFVMYDLDQPPSADGSTLYVAQLRPQGTANSQGSGTATLRLAADGKSAIITFDYSNLSGPITGMHIHGADTGIIFDVDSATPQPDGTQKAVEVHVFEESLRGTAGSVGLGAQ